jgi:hypothetical protein
VVPTTHPTDALDTVERSRRRVIDEIDVPAWYWVSAATSWIALGVIADLDHPLMLGYPLSPLRRSLHDRTHPQMPMSGRLILVGRSGRVGRC